MSSLRYFPNFAEFPLVFDGESRIDRFGLGLIHTGDDSICAITVHVGVEYHFSNFKIETRSEGKQGLFNSYSMIELCRSNELFIDPGRVLII